MEGRRAKVCETIRAVGSERGLLSTVRIGYSMTNGCVAERGSDEGRSGRGSQTGE